MEFDVNSPIIYLLAAIVIAFVMAQSVFFLVRALRQAKRLGMDKKLIRRIYHCTGGSDRYQRHRAGKGSGDSAAMAAPERGRFSFL